MLFRRPLTLGLGALALAFAGLAGAQVQGEEVPSVATPDTVRPDLFKADVTRAPVVTKYLAPASFDGLWCGTGLLHEFSLRLTQQHQQVHGSLARRDRVREIEGHIEGDVLHTQSTKIGSLVLERSGNELRVTGGNGIIALARGATFQLASAERCTG